VTLRHASFFSGVGGLDLGFERAGIETVSFSEIDPYASAVLATHWPNVPNLGDIVKIKEEDIPNAEIYSGGFPCQDLSVAGKRAGFAGSRSSLAFRFLEILERKRPEWVLLENVPGLLTSNSGRDFARLLDELGELGFGVSWRVLDAQYFGVPQRRRRVFLVGSYGSLRAEEVLYECECGSGDSPSRDEAGTRITRGSRASSASDRGRIGIDGDGSSVDADGNRASDGLARRSHNREGLESAEEKDGSLTGGGSDSPQSERIFRDSGTSPTLDTGRAIPHVYRKSARVSAPGSPETWVDDGIANTINTFDVGDIRSTHIVLGTKAIEEEGTSVPDSHRYRCCGNGVVSNVAEWIGRRLVAVDKKYKEAKL
jgi:site-specific DNA-cytosine methylase